MKNVGKYILGQIKNQNILPEEAKVLLKELKQNKAEEIEDIAIIGVACKLPNSNSADEFWDNIYHGRNCFVSKPPEKTLLDNLYKNPYFADLFDHAHWKKEDENVENFIGGFIKDFDKFDANFFGIPPREARYIDPQQRIFMEVAWSALEDAGYSEKSIRDSMTGIYVGRDGTNSNMYVFHTAYDALSVSGNWSGILASRLNYIYNLKGPAMIVDTACSAGLVAIHEACAALRNKECEMAIAGGISIGAAGVEQEKKEETKEDSDAVNAVVSDDNMIRTFDKNCSGTVFSEGCTVLLLKPLTNAIKDRDHVYGVIKGSAINSDGASNGLTAPNPVAQENVIAEAWKRARINPDEIDFIETHGTGTLLGDPIEVLGLSNAFKRYTNRKQFCGVGSVKTNIGHTVGAAGATNILKLALSLQNEVMPPTRNFAEPNPHINFMDSPVYVVDKPTPWKRSNKPRIAGASAWGFSGTNCHAVLQEPPILETTVNTKPFNIFTISAKTETAIKNYVINYDEYFKKKEDMNIEDVCFTSNEGRGHYSYRVAILAADYNDLKDKVAFLRTNGLDSYEDQDIYYGMHQIVSSKKKQKIEGDITEKELSEVSKQAKQYLVTLTDKETDKQVYRDNAMSLCSNYAKGANVDWELLYEGENVRKVSLPTYPFDRISYWGDKRDIGIKEYDNVNKPEKKHDFIDSCLVESINQTIYLLKFDLRTQWPLKDHVLVGNNVVSGTTYVEILKEGFERYYGTKKIEFDDITFLNTLIVTEEEPSTIGHLIINKENEGDSFLIASKRVSEDGEIVWTEHVKGRAHIHSMEERKLPAMAEIMESEHIKEIGVLVLSSFGERWNCVEKNFQDMESDNKIFYSFIKLPDKFAKDLETYTYHPGMLDDAINIIMLQIFTGTDFYIPFTYKSMKIYRNLPAHFYSKIVRHESGTGSEVLAYGITLIDEYGNLLAEIDECTVKKITKFNDYFSCNFYGTEWVETGLAEVRDTQITGNIIVFTDKGEVANTLIDRIKTNENNIYTVTFADEYKKDQNHYSITGSMEDYEQLLSDIGINTISKIYHFSTVDFDKKDYTYEDFEHEMRKGMYSIVYMNKVFSNKVKGFVDFVLVSDYVYKVTGNEECVKPANASFFGLIKALVYECPSFTFKCIDIDKDTSRETVIHTVLNTENDANRLALRNNTPYKEVLALKDTTSAKKKDFGVLQEGVYLITGGTGGLGLLMATNLSEFAACNICLVARSKVIDRSLWEQALIDNTDNKLCNLIKSIKNMEERGCRIIIKNSDVSDMASMNTLVQELKHEFGKINGVMHCAGVAGDGFNLNKPMEIFNNVINPKVYGSIVLAELVKDQPMDFFIMFSSMTSILGGPGQGDYTAANAFLDGYAYYLRSHGLQAQAINWPGFSETGMAVDYNLSDAVTLFKSLTNQLGVSIFNRIIRTDLTNVIPGTINNQFIAKIGINNLPIPLSEQLNKDFNRYVARNESAAVTEAAAALNPNDFIMTGKSEDEYTETEKTIAYIYAAVLNINQIDIYENFNALGGDSIISTEVYKLLNQQYNGLLSVSDIFLYPTVESIAEYVDSLLGKSADKEEVKTFSNVIEQFEQGEVDIDSIIDFLDDK